MFVTLHPAWQVRRTEDEGARQPRRPEADEGICNSRCAAGSMAGRFCRVAGTRPVVATVSLRPPVTRLHYLEARHLMQLSEQSREVRPHGRRLIVSREPMNGRPRRAREGGATTAQVTAAVMDERLRVAAEVRSPTTAFFSVTLQLAALHSLLEGPTQTRVATAIASLDTAIFDLRRSLAPPRPVARSCAASALSLQRQPRPRYVSRSS